MCDVGPGRLAAFRFGSAEGLWLGVSGGTVLFEVFEFGMLCFCWLQNVTVTKQTEREGR